jgi:hypothetical protein
MTLVAILHGFGVWDVFDLCSLLVICKINDIHLLNYYILFPPQVEAYTILPLGLRPHTIGLRTSILESGYGAVSRKIRLHGDGLNPRKRKFEF